MVHFTVLGWREIQVASLGEDQFSLGAAAPPRVAMAVVMESWRAGKRRLGGTFGGGSSVSESESDCDSGGRKWIVEGAVGSQSSSSSSLSLSSLLFFELSRERDPSFLPAFLISSSSARRIPSSRM